MMILALNIFGGIIVVTGLARFGRKPIRVARGSLAGGISGMLFVLKLWLVRL